MQEYMQEFAKSYYHVPSRFVKTGGVYIIRSGQNMAKPGYHVGPKTIECHSIHFVLEGEVLFQYEESEITLCEGDAFCLYPNRPYSYRRKSETDPLRMIWLAMGGEQVPALLSLSGFQTMNPYIRKKVGRDTMEVLDKLVQGIPRTYEEELTMQYRIYALFHRLTKRTEERFVSTIPERRQDWLKESIEYIRLHYTEHISIQDIAVKFGINRTYFSTRFTEETGLSPKRYLLRLRMEKGEQLLQTTSLSVTEIAMSLGYPDLYAFTRSFSRYFGYPPSRIRQNL